MASTVVMNDGAVAADSGSEDDDVHVCGACRTEFRRVAEFVTHKKQCTSRAKAKKAKAAEKAVAPAVVSVAVPVLDNNEAAVISLLANQLSNHGKGVASGSNPAAVGAPPPQLVSADDDAFVNFNFGDDYLTGMGDAAGTMLVPEEELMVQQQSATLVTAAAPAPLETHASPSKKRKRPAKSKPDDPKEPSSKAKKAKPSSDSTPGFACQVDGCKYVARYAKDLVRHARSHTGEKPFKCETCKRAFSRRDKLQAHERIHAGDLRHRCDICNYACVDSGAMKKHRRVHTNERPFKCQMCPYRSKDSSQLTVHLRTHTGDSPFVCRGYQGCTAAFKTNSDLTRHKRTHTGEKPFKCDKCNYAAADKCEYAELSFVRSQKPKFGT